MASVTPATAEQGGASPEQPPHHTGYRAGGWVGIVSPLLLALYVVANRENARSWSYVGIVVGVTWFSYLGWCLLGAGVGWIVGIFLRKADVAAAVTWTVVVMLGLGFSGYLASYFTEGWRDTAGQQTPPSEPKASDHQKVVPRETGSPAAPVAEAKAAALVEKLGGKVIRDEKLPGKPVVTVDLVGAKMTDADVRELAAFKNLTDLYLTYTPVTDAGLKELAALKSLSWLYLENTSVTGAGLKELAGLKNLTRLALGGARVTGAGLKDLAPLKALTTLSLAGTSVSDADLKGLAALQSLTELELQVTPVTDAGLRELAALKNLTYLNLSDTAVTDEGLKQLTALNKLTSIHLSRTLVTDDGARGFQQALPGCKITK